MLGTLRFRFPNQKYMYENTKGECMKKHLLLIIGFAACCLSAGKVSAGSHVNLQKDECVDTVYCVRCGLDHHKDENGCFPKCCEGCDLKLVYKSKECCSDKCKKEKCCKKDKCCKPKKCCKKEKCCKPKCCKPKCCKKKCEPCKKPCEARGNCSTRCAA